MHLNFRIVSLHGRQRENASVLAVRGRHRILHQGLLSVPGTGYASAVDALRPARWTFPAKPPGYLLLEAPTVFFFARAQVLRTIQATRLSLRQGSA
jgi:hypothetical protein